MASARAIARLEALIWVLIYAGLFTVVLGIVLQRSHDAAGWTLVGVGGAVAAVGAVLVWVRSRLKISPP